MGIKLKKKDIKLIEKKLLLINCTIFGVGRKTLMKKKLIALVVALMFSMSMFAGCGMDTEQSDIVKSSDIESAVGGNDSPQEHLRHVYGEWEVVNGETIRRCACGAYIPARPSHFRN